MTLKKEFAVWKRGTSRKSKVETRAKIVMNLDNLDYQDKRYHLDLYKIFSNKTAAINGVTEDIVEGPEV